MNQNVSTNTATAEDVLKAFKAYLAQHALNGAQHQPVAVIVEQHSSTPQSYNHKQGSEQVQRSAKA